MSSAHNSVPTSRWSFPAWMLDRDFWAARMAAALGACSSSVKLDEYQVEDRGSQAGGAGAGAGATGQCRSWTRATWLESICRAAPIPPHVAGLERVIYFDYDSYVVKA
jgi:hypothetical protein